jgi:hypothetical protein
VKPRPVGQPASRAPEKAWFRTSFQQRILRRAPCQHAIASTGLCHRSCARKESVRLSTPATTQAVQNDINSDLICEKEQYSTPAILPCTQIPQVDTNNRIAGHDCPQEATLVNSPKISRISLRQSKSRRNFWANHEFLAETPITRSIPATQKRD